MIVPPARKASFFFSQIQQGDALFVGEGNLSFVLSIAGMPGITAPNLIATTYEKASDLSDEGQQNAELLRRSGASVMNSIDTTKLDQYFPYQKFDTIVFQFPNAGSREPEYGRNPNYILIRDFLKSATSCLVCPQKNPLQTVAIAGFEPATRTLSSLKNPVVNTFERLGSC